jgi:hypothetical protein
LRRLGCNEQQVARHIKAINQAEARRLAFQVLREEEQQKQGTYWWH